MIISPFELTILLNTIISSCDMTGVTELSFHLRLKGIAFRIVISIRPWNISCYIHIIMSIVRIICQLESCHVSRCLIPINVDSDINSGRSYQHADL